MTNDVQSNVPINANAKAATSGLAEMHPAYFGMVMATGIVSIASHLLGMHTLAIVLLYANVCAYLALWALSIVRLAKYADRVIADFMNHGRSVGFFTIVAATCVLGSQFVVIANAWWVAWMLWLFGIALWAVLTYGIIATLTVKAVKPTLAEGINGGWLLAVVSSQAVAVLGAQLASGVSPDAQPVVLFFCLAMWLGGGMLYIWIISLIFYRYTFFALHPSDLAPPYWINMGAVAISTLAGTMLISNAPHSPVLQELLPFVKGLTIAFWATATWWIPMLVILGIWRHGYKRFPLRYDPLYWGAVFPLGMYTSCTYRIAVEINAPYLAVIPRYFIWIALAAWTLTSIGFVHRMLTRSNA